MPRKFDDSTAIARWTAQSVEEPAPSYVPSEFGPCLIWGGTLFGSGYGCVRYGRAYRRLHRMAWIIRHGEPPPETPYVLHRCDRRTCWADSHLWLGTQAQNCVDMVDKKRHVNTRKTHCVNGHPLDGDNLYRQPGDASRRGCRTCYRERMRRLMADPEYREKKREWEKKYRENKKAGISRKNRRKQNYADPPAGTE